MSLLLIDRDAGDRVVQSDVGLYPGEIGQVCAAVRRPHRVGDPETPAAVPVAVDPVEDLDRATDPQVLVDAPLQAAGVVGHGGAVVPSGGRNVEAVIGVAVDVVERGLPAIPG